MPATADPERRREFGLSHAIAGEDNSSLDAVIDKTLSGLIHTVSMGISFTDRASQMRIRGGQLKSRFMDGIVQGLGETYGIMVFMDKQSLRNGTAIKKARRY